MKTKSFVLSSVVIGLFLMSFVAAGSNLIDNPGFEDGLNDWAESCWWENSCDAEVEEIPWDLGNHAVKLTAHGVAGPGDFAASSVYTDYELKLDKNSEYKLSSWVYMKEDADVEQQLPRMMIVLFETKADWQNNVYASDPSSTEPHSKVFTNIVAGNMEEVEIEFETNDYLYAKVLLIAEAHDEAGDELAEVWFDDVVLEKISEDDDDNHKRDKKELFFKDEFCMPNWQCSGWSECSDGGRTRQCSDASFCGLDINKPMEASGCVVDPVMEKVLVEEPNYLLWVLGALLIILILILIALAMRG